MSSMREEVNMRKFFLSLAAAAAVLTAGIATGNADAAGPAPAGLNRAIRDVSVVDRVHCVPGWRHHYPTRWRFSNGCARFYRYGYVGLYPFWTYRWHVHPRRVVRIHRFHRYGHFRVYRHTAVRIHRPARIVRFHGRRR
jgi:hypothetical protein